MSVRSDEIDRSYRVSRWQRRLLLALALWPCSGAAVLAQEEPAAATQSEVTAELIESRRQEVEAATDLSEDAKSSAVEAYRQAADGLGRAEELRAAAAQFGEAAAAVDARQQAISTELSELKASPEEPLPQTGDLPELEQRLTQLETELADLKNTQTEWEAEPKRRSNRRKEIRALLVAAPERLAEIARQQAAPPPGDESPILTTARETELRVRQQVAELETAALQAELAQYDSEESVDLVRAQRDLLVQKVTRLEEHVALVSEMVNRRRREEAAESVEQARLDAVASNPVLRPWAERNRELAEEAQTLAPQIESVERDLRLAKELHEQVSADFADTRGKIETVRLSGPIGLVLRKQRAGLPNVSERRRDIRQRRAKIDEVHLKLFEYDDERSQLADLDRIVEGILRTGAAQRSADEAIVLENDATAILERQQEYLDQLNRSYNTYFDRLVALDTQEQVLIDETERFAAFIDEHVLWIRSDPPLSFTQFGADDEAMLWLCDSENWSQTGELVWNNVLENVAALAISLAVFGVFFQLRMRFRRELRAIGEEVKRPTVSDFGLTSRSTLLTLFIAAFWPLVLLYISWRLSVAGETSEFATAVSDGVRRVAFLLFPLEVLRNLCRANGLAEAHFGWSRKAVLLLSSNLRWLYLLALPLVFVTAMLSAHRVEFGRDTFERLCYIATMIVLSMFVYRVLQPGKGLFREIIAYNQGGWLEHLRYVWFWGAVATPLALSALAGLGYFYTALQFHEHLLSTIWLLIGLVVARSFLLRWLFVHRRQMSIEQAKQRRAAAQQNAAADGETSLPVAGAEQADLATISSQIQRLLNAGLVTALLLGMWLIWVDVLPALNILDRWELGRTMVQVTENTAPEGSPPRFELVTKNEPITAADMALAGLVALLTIIAARNVPGLLEMSLLQRLPMDGALRYAVITLARYLIVLAGLVVGFGAIGVGWSKVQWLATALTFGLAFGLQEIFANFVSGLIILFEQPIRVGDVVTIEGTTGVVSKIRIRATTIVDWDRKEFIVPNREFITGRLLNWTLSDSINRVVVNVGVAYGTDTRKARSIIERIAQEHPTILDDPSPMVTFEQFGDSTLNFVLRAYLPNMDNRLSVVHQLHTNIDDAFREAEIEIAFPQQDLHIRSLPDATPAIAPAAKPTASAHNGGSTSREPEPSTEDAQF